MLGRLKRVATWIGAAATFVVVSMLCGLLVAGLFIPAAASSGIGAQAADEQLAKLPTEMQTPPQAQRTTVLDADGGVLTHFYDQNRVYVGLNRIAPVMRSAVLAIEDHRFYEHGAFDPVGTLRAFLTNSASGATVQGGSSITQQYVKMVLVHQASLAGDQDAVEAARAPTYHRKMTELRYAIALEQKLGKDAILERYLNLAYFGDGAYGVEAAARHFFGTSAAELTLPQATMLAGLVQSPDSTNPVQHPRAAIDRRNEVIDRMAELGEITPHAAAAARQTKFRQRSVQPASNGCVSARYPNLCDYVRRSLLQLPSLGDTVADRERRLDRGGLTVQTSIDPQAQDAAQRAIGRVVGATDPLISTMNMIEPGTGKIIAMAQNRTEMGNNTARGETYLNYSVSPSMGGAGGFQAGSTFKPFVAAAALDQGVPIAKTYRVQPRQDFSGTRFQSCKGPSWIDGWKVRNTTGHRGRINMAQAAVHSSNTYFVRLELDTGMCAVTRMAERLGARSSLPDRPISSYHDKPSFTLGTVEVPPISMAEAYATFAAGGIHCDPVIISAVTSTDGEKLTVPDADCTRVLSADVAKAVNRVLSAVVQRGATGVQLPDGRDQAGKTGTIDSSEAVWFAGYTPEIAGAAMISVDRTRKPWAYGDPGRRSNGLNRYRVPSTGVVLDGSGGVDAGRRIWRPAVRGYLKDKPAGQFGTPSPRLRFGPMLKVPDVTGWKAAKAVRRLERLGPTVQQQRRPSKKVDAGRVLKVVPDRVRTYGSVRVIISAGDPDDRDRPRADRRRGRGAGRGGNGPNN